MKNIALFLFLVVLSSACTKDALIDQDLSVNKTVSVQIRDDASLLKNYLASYNAALGLEGLRSLHQKREQKSTIKKLTTDPRFQKIVAQQTRVAEQFRQLPESSRKEKINSLSQEKSFGDWRPYYGNCTYELQLEKQRLLLQYYECLAGAHDEAEEQHCLFSYLKKNAGIELESYACTHSVTTF